MQDIHKIFVVYDEKNEPCMVAPTRAKAQSYVNWFLRKDKKYRIDYLLVNSLKMSQDEIKNMLKDFSP